MPWRGNQGTGNSLTESQPSCHRDTMSQCSPRIPRLPRADGSLRNKPPVEAGWAWPIAPMRMVDDVNLVISPNGAPRETNARYRQDPKEQATKWRQVGLDPPLQIGAAPSVSLNSSIVVSPTCWCQNKPKCLCPCVEDPKTGLFSSRGFRFSRDFSKKSYDSLPKLRNWSFLGPNWMLLKYTLFYIHP